MSRMGKLIEEGMKAGYLLAVEGCMPSAKGGLPFGGQGVSGVERRPDLQIQRSRLVHGELQDAKRSGLLLAEALAGRRQEGPAMRLVERQIRALVANRAHDVEQDVAGQGYGEVGTRDERGAANEETRYQ